MSLYLHPIRNLFIQPVFTTLFLLTLLQTKAQTEFPKEFSLHLRVSSGMITKPAPAPALFAGSLQAVPQVTLAEHLLRGGLVAGGFYADLQIRGLIGPTVSVLLRELKGGYFGSLGNFHLSADHLWGSGRQHLVGGGLNLDLLNKVVLSVTAHRDYTHGNWWIQSAFAFRVSKARTPTESFPH